MRSRNTHVRTKVVALLVSLTMLWAFAAYVTVREGLNLLWVTVQFDSIGNPLDTVVQSLQEERRLSLAGLSGNSVQLRTARTTTDAAVADFLEKSQSSSLDISASDVLKQRLAEFRDELKSLNGARFAVDEGSPGLMELANPYNALIDSAFAVNRSLASWDDEALARTTRALVNMVYAREILTRENALIDGTITVGAITAEERATFSQYVGTRRFLHTEAANELSGELQTRLSVLRGSERYQTFEAAENAIMAAPVGFGTGADTWRLVAEPMIQDFRTFEEDAVDVILAQAQPAAIGTLVRLAAAGLLGLAAVIASIVISITTARQLVRQLGRLRNAARDLASYRLPRVVERLQQGEQVDVRQEAPPLDFGRDEIGQVGEAFNQVQETAIRVAVEQAELRRSIRDVFLSLARRSQALLHRQLGLLDAMERRATDSEELAELFRIDHLATRMRRNAENLIVLSGATAGRAWRKPVPMVDVLRGALAEVEDYTRVTVLPVGNASLLGRAVGDVIHLLAELIENAVSFSPPQTTVRVGGSVVGYGFAIEIEDRGLGMTSEELTAANEQLRDPPEFRLTSTARLGLYVVGKLAERHGIRVRLAESPYGGTTAIVLLPGSIMAEGDADESLDPRQLDSYRPAQLAGVGRHRLQTEIDRSAPARGESATALAEAHHEHNGIDVDAPIVPANGRPVAAAPPLPSAHPPVPTPAPAPAPEPPAARPEPTRGDEPPKFTASGLPWRQRAATDEPTTAAGGVVAAGSGASAARPTAGPQPRDPDTTRSMMDSYRSGTLRGRTDAARLAGGDAGAPTPPDGPSAPEEPTSPAPALAGSGEYPQWTQSTVESPQWTESHTRTTEEGG